MTTVPYLWVFILFTMWAVATLIVSGVSAALRTAGYERKRIRKITVYAAVMLFGWMALDVLLGWLGLFRAGVDRRFPYIVLGITLPVVAGIWLIRKSQTVRAILHATPQQWIVGIQFYRGMGSMFLVLLGWRLLPAVFALPAGFGDVLVGITALLIAGTYASGMLGRNWLVVLWNIFGIADLVIALTTGFLSAPGPLQQLSLGTPNYLVGLYPLVMIPVYAVPLSLVLHAASLTKLTWRESADKPKEIPDSALRNYSFS
jgi:hypothetical protein